MSPNISPVSPLVSTPPCAMKCMFFSCNLDNLNSQFCLLWCSMGRPELFIFQSTQMFIASHCPTSHICLLLYFRYLLSPHSFHHLVKISHHSENMQIFKLIFSPCYLFVHVSNAPENICDIFWCHQWLFCVIYLIKILCPLKQYKAIYCCVSRNSLLCTYLIVYSNTESSPWGISHPVLKRPCFSFYLYFN